MYLTYGTLSLSVGLLLFFIAMLGGRKPVTPFWAGESMMANIITPMIVCLLAVGVIEIIQVFLTGMPTVKDLMAAAVVAAATAGLYMMMGVRRKIAEYDAASKGGEVIRANFGKGGPNDSNLPSGTSTPPLRKAA